MITETEASQIIAEMMDSYNKPLSLIETQAWLDVMTRFPKSVVVEAWKRWTAGNKFFPLRDEWGQLAYQVQKELRVGPTAPPFPNTPWRERNFNLSLLEIIKSPLVYRFDLKDILGEKPGVEARIENLKVLATEAITGVDLNYARPKVNRPCMAHELTSEGIFDKLRELYPEFTERINNFEKDYCKAFKIISEKQQEPKKELWYQRL